MDSERRRLGRWIDDSVHVEGGYGVGDAGLFDPVDMASHHLDIFILGRSENRISRFDPQLNFIQSIPVSNEDGGLFPTVMGINSRGWIYVYSPEKNEIYRVDVHSIGLDRFMDLNTLSGTENCVSAMRFGRNDRLALLLDCVSEVHLFTRSGKLERRFRIEIEDPEFILPIKKSWLILNQKGDAQILGETPFALMKNGVPIQDVMIDEGFFNILTDSELIILDIDVVR
ncbi:MAG: hypothetical protein U9N31_00055 [Candidatus Marinimicrobia bacterium]|nr:hypothetical protein [Candidatus Neomarinimicrobiota bacterium]